MKSIVARNIPEDIYFELKKIQAELKCRSWASTFRQLIEIYRNTSVVSHEVGKSS